MTRTIIVAALAMVLHGGVAHAQKPDNAEPGWNYGYTRASAPTVTRQVVQPAPRSWELLRHILVPLRLPPVRLDGHPTLPRAAGW
jgi:hypothetical protein